LARNRGFTPHNFRYVVIVLDVDVPIDRGGGTYDVVEYAICPSMMSDGVRHVNDLRFASKIVSCHEV
jgi:hypothetical protein